MEEDEELVKAHKEVIDFPLRLFAPVLIPIDPHEVLGRDQYKFVEQETRTQGTGRQWEDA